MGRFDDTFVESRRRSLEHFLSRSGQHSRIRESGASADKRLSGSCPPDIVSYCFLYFLSGNICHAEPFRQFLTLQEQEFTRVKRDTEEAPVRVIASFTRVAWTGCDSIIVRAPFFSSSVCVSG